MKYDYVVVGAGFAGATIAERLANDGASVLVVEQRDHIGGNCYDYVDQNGITIHKYGPHIFHTKSKEVWDYLSQFTKWLPYMHKVLANIDGELISLPVSLKTLHQLYKKGKADSIEKKLIERYGKGNKTSLIELLQSEDLQIKQFAEAIFEKIFFNYSKKQWGCNPLELDPQVLNRLPVWLDYDDHYFKDAYQGIPKDGYTKIMENMLDNRNIEIILKKDYKMIIGDIAFSKLFYTGSIDYYFDYKHGKLPYRALKFEFEALGMEWFQPNSVVNYPGKELFTRITEFKHFNNYKSDKTIVLRELPEDYEAGKNNPSYPIPNEANHELYNQYKIEADKLDNVVFAGRLGEYKYYNMDEVVGKALRIYGN